MKFVRPYLLLLKAFVLIGLGGGFAFLCFLWTVFSILSALGLAKAAAIIFTGLYAFFAFVAFSQFVSFDVLSSLKTANDRLNKEGLRAGSLYRKWITEITDQFGFNVLAALCAVFCFVVSCASWSIVDPSIFSRRASDKEVACFILDLTSRGLLADYCASLAKKRDELLVNGGHDLFVEYMKSYHFYITFALFGALAKVASTARMIHKFPDHKTEIKRLAYCLERETTS